MHMQSADNKGCWPLIFADIRITIVINDYEANSKRIPMRYQYQYQWGGLVKDR